MKLLPTLIVARLCCLALLVLATSGAANAQSCSFSITDLNFGTVDLVQGNAVDVSGTFEATCSGLNTFVRICPNIGAGSGGMDGSGSPRYMLNGGNQLAFNLYQDAARTVPWGSTLDGAGTNPPTVDITLSLLGVTVTRPIYGRVFANQQTLPTGTYLSSFSGIHTAIAFRGLNLLNASCADIGSQNAQQAPFTVQLVHAPTCGVTATSMNFGTASSQDIANGVNATSTITATCSSGTPYSIALDGGLANASNPVARKMASGGNQLTYGLYLDAARTMPWGDQSGTNTFESTGAGTGQSVTVFGRVPGQSVPPAGTYSDTIVVTLSY